MKREKDLKLMVKISVIVPLYQGKKYIASILNMVENNLKSSAGKFEIEVAFINDFPQEVILQEEIESKAINNIILMNNERNYGIHYSRIKGLSCTEGDYVLFLDQDDKIADNYFMSQIQHSSNGDVVVANGTVQDQYSTKRLYRYWIMQWTVKHIWFYAKFDCRIISPGQCLIKRSSISDVWKRNVIAANGADDYFLWLLLLSKGCNFKINRECIYTHVFTSVNASLDSEKMKESVREVLEKGEKHIDSNSVKIIRNRIEKKGKSLLIRLIERINRNT